MRATFWRYDNRMLTGICDGLRVGTDPEGQGAKRAASIEQ